MELNMNDETMVSQTPSMTDSECRAVIESPLTSRAMKCRAREILRLRAKEPQPGVLSPAQRASYGLID
jgi:hypothetical protein